MLSLLSRVFIVKQPGPGCQSGRMLQQNSNRKNLQDLLDNEFGGEYVLKLNIMFCL
jgi:hypothetical protein